MPAGRRTRRGLDALGAAAAAVAAAAKASGSCWQGDLQRDHCCGLELGDRGHPGCFDAVYTYERCCLGEEEQARLRLEAAAWEAATTAAPEGTEAKTPEVFDYVVVGAGSGGSAAAAALASHSSRPTVLLLDAGSWDQSSEYYGSTVVNTSMNSYRRPVWWLVRGAPPFRAYDKVGWAIKVGRTLGGSSALNKGLHLPGGLYELARALRWPEERLRASFRRLSKALRRGALARRFVGPVLLEQGRGALPEFLQRMADAFEANGVPFVPIRQNSEPSQTIHGVKGGSWLSLTCPQKLSDKEGRVPEHLLLRCARQSSYAGLVAARNRSLPNLHVRPSSLTTRLLWSLGAAMDGSALEATGVEVVELREDALGAEKTLRVGEALTFDRLNAAGVASFLGRRYAVSARRAIVLAAGAFGSPALLMRSGLGDQRGTATPPPPGAAPHSQVLRRSLGRGLRDRLALPFMVEMHEPCKLPGRVTDAPFLFAFFNFSGEAANIPGRLGPVEAELNVVEGCNSEGRQIFSLRFILQRIRSSGRVVVTSPHPLVSPQAQLRGSDADAASLAEMLRWFDARILRHPAVAPLLRGRQPAEDIVGRSWSIDAFVRQNAEWYLHPSGSLSAADVIDSGLRLRGTTNVRIADASVLRAGAPSGHPDVTIRMIGEAVAQLLLEEQQHSSSA